MPTAPRDGDAPTRERILEAAARIAGERGYHGASTRAIAAAAGIRQSTLFHHFQTKEAVFDALLVAALAVPDEHARRVATIDAPAAARLYRYLVWDASAILSAPVSLAGLFLDQLRGTPQYERWAPTLASWLAALGVIIRDGQTSGEFLAVPVPVAVEMLHAASIAAIRLRDRGIAEDADMNAHAIARMTLRMLLVDPAGLDDVVACAATLVIDEPPLLRWSSRDRSDPATD